MIALGEAILAVGIAYTAGAGFKSVAATLGLVIAFVTTVLLWRIYIFRAGALTGRAVMSAHDPARLGRFAAAAHVLMIMGIVSTAVGHELVQHHPTGRTYPTWLAVIVGGPALYLVGRALLEHVVFSRVSAPRVLGVAALLLLTIPLAFAPALAAVAAVPVVLLAITLADIRRSAGKPTEVALPGG